MSWSWNGIKEFFICKQYNNNHYYYSIFLSKLQFRAACQSWYLTICPFMSLTSTNLWATTGCSVNLLLFACVALTLEAKWVIRPKNNVIAWSLAMVGKWMDQLLPLMMQANFENYFNIELWLTFIWLILLSVLLDDRGHFSKCRSFSSSAV